MADTKTSDLTELAAAPAATDLAMVVDVSDTTMAASGTNKKITIANLLGGVQPLDSDLTAIAALTTTAYGRSLLEAANAAALRTLGGLVIGTDVASQSAFQAHLDDTTDAHDASAISFAATGSIAGTDVQTAVAEVASEAASALAAHEADTTSVHGITDTSALVTLTGSQTLTNKTLTHPILTLEQGTSPSNTTEGRIQWDTDDNRIVIGDGSTTKTFSDDSVNAATYQPLDSDLTAIAALTTTAFGRGLLALADAAALRTAAGTGTIATQNSNNVTITGGSISGITDLPVADGGTGSSTASGARTNLDAQQTLSGLSLTDVGTPASGDLVLLQDASDSNNLKVAQFSTFGGGGGGSVATDTIFDAKGDLAVGTGSDTADNLTVGSNGQQIFADSAESTGLKWGWPVVLPVVPGTGDFIGPPPGSSYSTGAASGSAATANGRAIFTPLIVRRACSIASLRCEVTTGGDASSVVRLALFASDASGLPGTLIGQGTAAADSTGGKTVALSTSLAGGLYWAAAVWQGGVPTTAPVFRTTRGPLVGYDEATGSSPNLIDYYADGTTGAFASNPSVTATVHGTTTGTAPAIYLEVA